MSLFQLPGEVSKVTSMSNRRLRIQFDSQENLSQEQMATTMGLVEKYVWACFMPDTEIAIEDVINLPKLPAREDNQKSDSQRLRACLYVLWEQQGKKGDYELFYRTQMDRFINAVKEKLT
jgi:hypothetical protein